MEDSFGLNQRWRVILAGLMFWSAAWMMEDGSQHGLDPDVFWCGSVKGRVQKFSSIILLISHVIMEGNIRHIHVE